MFTINTKTSDLLLRPEVSLLLPFLTATHPTLLLLSTALLPLKWASGCNCFDSLCRRKRITRYTTYMILATLLLTTITKTAIPAVLPVLLALATQESFDTKLLKAVMLLCGRHAFGFIPAALALLAYLRLAGYSVRLADSWELLLSNQVWLLTKDYRLAKRVNADGEFHAEVLEQGKARLVGDGRLVGVGKGVVEIDVERFDGTNMHVLRVAESRGRVVVDGKLVKIVGN